MSAGSPTTAAGLPCREHAERTAAALTPPDRRTIINDDMRLVSLKDCRHAIDIERSRNRSLKIIVDGNTVTLDNSLRRLDNRNWICGDTIIRRRYQVDLTRIARLIIADEKETLDQLKRRIAEAGKSRSVPPTN